MSASLTTFSTEAVFSTNVAQYSKH